MRQRDYLIYDVFTDRAGAGNPLAVVLDAEGLDAKAMQRIAADFNFSETTFVTPAGDPAHTARVRIFTPHYEMPFAGHPTVGTAIALAESAGGDAAGAEILVLEENIGPVRCAVTRAEAAPFAEFDLPRLPERLALEVDAAAVGAALGLDPQDIGFENHRIGLWSAGVPYVAVPVSGLEAAARARIDSAAWTQLAPARGDAIAACAYVYCRQAVNSGASFHARMLMPEAPHEDPATGSAAAAFAGAIAAFDRPLDGPLQLWIEQGVEMGRPSAIRLSMELAGGELAAARIGGHAVKASGGRLTA